MTLDTAKLQARRFGYFIVTVADGYLLYKEDKPKNRFVAKRKNEAGIIALVKKTCATT